MYMSFHHDETIRTIDESPEQLLLQLIAFELVFPMLQISKLYHLPHKPMQGDEIVVKRLKFGFSQFHRATV